STMRDSPGDAQVDSTVPPCHTMRDASRTSLVDTNINYAHVRTAEWANNIPQSGGTQNVAPAVEVKAQPQEMMWPTTQYPSYPINMMTVDNMAQYSPLALYTHQMHNILYSSQVSSSTASPAPMKKKPTPVPAELKDATYLERRKRNNESAKRSREQRRAKEDSTHKSYEICTEENRILKLQLFQLRQEYEQLRALFSASQLSMATVQPPFIQ
ncbi:hypothetical protein PFISCL1PPCAC_17384, partial [Pristionchus fissidentatus]